MQSVEIPIRTFDDAKSSIIIIFYQIVAGVIQPTKMIHPSIQGEICLKKFPDSVRETWVASIKEHLKPAR